MVCGTVVSLVWKLIFTIRVTFLIMSHYKKIYHLRMQSGNSKGYWLVYCQIQYLATVVQLHLPQKCPWSVDSHSCMYVCGRQWSTGKHIGPEKRVQQVIRSVQCSGVRQWPIGRQIGPENRVEYVIRSAQHFGVMQWPNGWQIGPKNKVEYVIRKCTRFWGKAVASPENSRVCDMKVHKELG